MEESFGEHPKSSQVILDTFNFSIMSLVEEVNVIEIFHKPMLFARFICHLDVFTIHFINICGGSRKCYKQARNLLNESHMFAWHIVFAQCHKQTNTHIYS